MPPLRTRPPDEIERARILYEETDLSPHDIARMLQIGTDTFYRRVHRWGWRRRLRVSEVDAMAHEAALARDETARESGMRVLDQRMSAIARAKAAVMGEFRALSLTQERVTQAAAAAAKGDRAARAIHRLAQALVEIERFEREEREAADRARGRRAPAPARDETDEIDEREAEAMRRELSERLKRLVAAGGWPDSI